MTMNRWGIGHILFRTVFLYTLLALFYDELLFASRAVPGLSHPALTGLGALLVLTGILLHGSAMGRVYHAFDHQALTTRGVYSVLRHPMYAAWVGLILPGMALMCPTPLMLGLPVVAWIVYVGHIEVEERGLEARFGEAYRAYRARVGGVVPRLVRE